MNNKVEYFDQRIAALGTKHEKEKVIAPILKKDLGVVVLVPKNFDSDQFGTFTLDVPRIYDQVETARKKATLAIEMLNLEIGIASEGSFNSDPNLPSMTLNTEVIIYIDKKYDFEVFGISQELAPRARNAIVGSIDEILEFASSIDFPKHGIVLRSAEKDYSMMTKGIKDHGELKAVASDMLKINKNIWVETDLRAHFNHSRMENIKKATINLVENLKNNCPKCGVPGFRRTESKPGLPCETCGLPTQIALSDVFTCKKCDHKSELLYPSGEKTAYAGYCDYCNP